MKVEIEKSKIRELALQIQAANMNADGKIISFQGLITENIKASVKHRLQKIYKKLIEELSSIDATCKDLSEEDKNEFMKDKSSFDWEGCDYEMIMNFESKINYDFDLIEEYFCEKK